MDTGTPSELALVLPAITAIAYGIFFCLLLWWLVIKLFRWLVRHAEAFGATVVIRIVSLGITAWLLPDELRAPIDATVAFVKSFLDQAPPLIASVAAYHRSGDFGNLFGFMPKLTGMFMSALTGFLTKISLPGLVLAVALWVAVGTVMSALSGKRTMPAASKIFSRLTKISNSALSQIALFSVVAFGCFLSIAAIVAVPYLRQPAEPTETEVAQLVTRLNDEAISKEVYRERYPDDIPAPSTFIKFRDTVRQGSSNGEGTAPDHPELAIASGLLDTLEGTRNTLIADYKELRDRGFQQQAILRDMAISTFSVNGGRGKQERARYSSELEVWYGRQISTLEGGLSGCMRTIRASDSAVSIVSGVFEPTISGTGGYPANRQALDALKEATGKLAKGCEFNVGDSLPQPPELTPASYWGPFGWIARWLLHAGSLDLALITGMLGFGLFGAAISTVVRRGTPHSTAQDQALVTHLMSVIIRGLSAAIVVFLATLGGLAIFSASESGQGAEPSPYSLFLTCLAAAVFSEDIWLAVRRRFRERTNLRETDSSSRHPLDDAEGQRPAVGVHK